LGGVGVPAAPIFFPFNRNARLCRTNDHSGYSAPQPNQRRSNHLRVSKFGDRQQWVNCEL